MTDKSLCDSCTNIGCEFQSGIVRTKCAFYMPPQLEPDNCGNYVVQDSTTKNNIRDNRVKNELNRVKDELEPTTKNDLPHCQHTDEEIAKSFIEDVEAVKDQLHTKNDLGVDCISRKSVITIIQNHWWNCRDIDKLVNELPPVTPQEQFKPMVEIDLYSVIKQKYVEREVLDKIRTEIESKHARAKQMSSVLQMNAYTDCLQIIDKYKVESEVQ